MSILIELTSEEIKVLSNIMVKVGTPIISIKKEPAKKLSKTELGLQSIREYRARKKRNH